MTASIRIDQITAWDSVFLTRFVKLQKKAQSENPEAIYENLNDYEKFFSRQSEFNKKNNWSLWILAINNNDVVRLGCSHPIEAGPNYLGVGFFESLKSVPLEALEQIFKKCEDFANAKNLREIRLPMQGGFFGSFRARLISKEAAYFTEPQTLSFYIPLWESLGFKLSKTWCNFVVDVSKARKNCEETLLHFYGQKSLPGLDFDHIGQKNLDQDLLRLRTLFIDSYHAFEDFSLISENEFLELYRPYGFIFKNFFCVIATHERKDVGFVVSIPDLNPVLKFNQRWRFPLLLQKINILMYLKFFKYRMSYPYVGKKETCSSLKGFIAAAFLESLKQLPPWTKQVSWQYIASDSPTKKMLNGEIAQPASEFGLFKKALF